VPELLVRADHPVGADGGDDEVRGWLPSGAVKFRLDVSGVVVPFAHGDVAVVGRGERWVTADRRTATAETPW
jgi:hypothetical protein